MLSVKSMVSIALIVAIAAFVSPDVLAAPNDAKSAGTGFLNTLEGVITGNIGLMIGLALAVLGIYTWVVKQETSAGILLIIGGVLITIAPGVFNTIGEVVAPLVKATGADSLDTVKDVPR